MALEIRVLSREWVEPLGQFFSIIRGAVEHYFHPHPLTEEFAGRTAQHTGKDLYYVLVDGREVLAYGMLRGWDEGYDIPSLGIVVHPDSRGKGLGELLMHFLHDAARRQGARELMLRVCRENVAAYELYVKLGYRFGVEERGGQLVGRLTL